MQRLTALRPIIPGSYGALCVRLLFFGWTGVPVSVHRLVSPLCFRCRAPFLVGNLERVLLIGACMAALNVVGEKLDSGSQP